MTQAQRDRQEAWQVVKHADPYYKRFNRPQWRWYHYVAAFAADVAVVVALISLFL